MPQPPEFTGEYGRMATAYGELLECIPWDVFSTWSFSHRPRGRTLERSNPFGKSRGLTHTKAKGIGKTSSGSWQGSRAPQTAAVTEDGALHFARQHLRALEDQVNGWSMEQFTWRTGADYARQDAMRKAVPRAEVYAWVATEIGDTGGLIHLHALIGGVKSLRRFCGAGVKPWERARECCMTHLWPCGVAKVLPFKRDLGAAFYVTKYVTKKFGAWDLIGPVPGAAPVSLENNYLDKFHLEGVLHRLGGASDKI